MDASCDARILATALALVVGACEPWSEERVRAEPTLRVLEPDVTTWAETPLHTRARPRLLAGAETPAGGGGGARPDPRAPQVRVPVTTVLVIPDLGPAGSAGVADPGPAQVVSFAPGALLTPTSVTTSPAPIQGLPASPQSYGSVRTNFGPTGAILGGTFGAPSYGSAIR